MKFNILNKEITIKRDVIVALSIFLAVLLGMITYAIARKDGDVVFYSDTDCDLTSKAVAGEDITSDEELASNIVNDSADNKNDNTEHKTEEIKVYVIGCVRNPGIVTLKKGQLVDDAVKKAGGLTEDADIYNINLVYSLNENMMLRIKSKSEVNEEGNKDGVCEEGKGVDIIIDGGNAVNIAGQSTNGKAGKININTASVSELDTLPGIGIATANDIIAYREANGRFKSIEDIMKVPRIKESRFNNIKDFITVD